MTRNRADAKATVSLRSRASLLLAKGAHLHRVDRRRRDGAPRRPCFPARTAVGACWNCTSNAPTLPSRPWRYAVSGPSGPSASPSPGAGSRLDPAALPISLITKRDQVVHCHQTGAGSRPAPRTAGDRAWRRPADATPVCCSSSRRRVFNGLPIRQFVEMVGALGDFALEPVKLSVDCLVRLRGARWPPRVGFGLAARPHAPQRGRDAAFLCVLRPLAVRVGGEPARYGPIAMFHAVTVPLALGSVLLLGARASAPSTASKRWAAPTRRVFLQPRLRTEPRAPSTASRPRRCLLGAARLFGPRR